MNRHPVILKIKESIRGTKYENTVFVAGGFVRDYFLDRPSKDIDLLVIGHGLRGGVEFAWFLYRVIGLDYSPVTFERFGTAQIKILDVEVEVVAARKESYNFKDRNPVVEEGTMDDDINRRDFTMNALLWDISNEALVDHIGGITDIHNGIIRTTGNPKIIFAEDPLRIMRAIRFASQLGFSIEPNTWNAIVEFVPWLNKISNERIRDELNKILLSKYASKGLNMLKQSGILEYIIPQFKALYAVKRQGSHHVKSAWYHTLDVIYKSPNTIEHKLAALLHDIGKGSTMSVGDDGDIHFYQHQYASRKIARNFMLHYKYTSDQVFLVCKAIELHMNFIEHMLDTTIRRIVNEVGKDVFEFCLDLADADSKNPERKKIVEHIRQFINSDGFIIKKTAGLPVNGDIIMKEFNLFPGKRIGELLSLEQEWIYENPNITSEEIIERLRTEVQNVSSS